MPIFIVFEQTRRLSILETRTRIEETKVVSFDTHPDETYRQDGTYRDQPVTWCVQNTGGETPIPIRAPPGATMCVISRAQSTACKERPPKLLPGLKLPNGKILLAEDALKAARAGTHHMSIAPHHTIGLKPPAAAELVDQAEDLATAESIEPNPPAAELVGHVDPYTAEKQEARDKPGRGETAAKRREDLPGQLMMF